MQPNTPCQFFGDWESSRPECRYRISLRGVRNFYSVFYAITLFFYYLNAVAASAIFQVELSGYSPLKANDSVLISRDNDKTVFLVINSSGIGGATISLEAGDWPKHIVLRFQYDQMRGFKSLESLDIITSRFQIKRKGGTSDRMLLYFAGQQDKFDSAGPPAGELYISFKENQGAIEVMLPAYLLLGSKYLKISWIDAYR